MMCDVREIEPALTSSDGCASRWSLDGGRGWRGRMAFEKGEPEQRRLAPAAASSLGLADVIDEIAIARRRCAVTRSRPLL